MYLPKVIGKIRISDKFPRTLVHHTVKLDYHYQHCVSKRQTSRGVPPPAPESGDPAGQCRQRVGNPPIGTRLRRITDDILAMARPSTASIAARNIIQQFHSWGIRTVINLQTPGEHASCGPPLTASGFTYEPAVFMSNDIYYYNFAWEDYGEASLSGLLDMTKVLAFSIQQGRVAIHCHAGLGRTGVLIACHLVYSLRVRANDAIRLVRRRRPRSVQTSGQILCVQQFEHYFLPQTVLFSSREPHLLTKDKKTAEFTLRQHLHRQRATLHGLEERTFKALPKTVFLLCERLLRLCGCQQSLGLDLRVRSRPFYRRFLAYRIRQARPPDPTTPEDVGVNNDVPKLPMLEWRDQVEEEVERSLETVSRITGASNGGHMAAIRIHEAFTVDHHSLPDEKRKYLKELRTDINMRTEAMSRIDEEEDPVILTGLLLEWLEGLKQPVLDREDLSIIVSRGQDVESCISSLPMVADDGQLPRTLCPGCTIQLEATVEFFNLIISGQKIIRELHQREKEYKKSLLLRSAAEQSEIITEKIVYEINTSDGVFHVEHPIALQVAGLERPRRKRGRPPKKTKSPEELAQEIKEKEEQLAREAAMKENFLNGEAVGKRRRKTPTRFREAVQGKELERIFIEEGMIDPEEKEPSEEKPAPPPAPEVIGHLREAGGLVAVTRGRGRGRPRGRTRPTLSQCSVCGLQFSCSWRYMSHLASHQRRAPEPSAETDTKTEGKVDTPQQLPTLPETSDTTSDNIAEIDTTASDNTAQNDLDNSESTIIKMEIEQTSDAVVEVTSSPVSKPEGPSMEIEPAEEESELVKGKKKLKCNVCDKMFSNRQSKSMHMKAVHAGERPYQCQECGLSFPYPRSLSVHALRHRRAAAGKGFACDLCGKVLNHPSSVVYHKEAEHAGRQYVCINCGKGFKHRQLLQRHQLVHTQIRPHTCKICAATFKTKANLMNHQLRHSGVKKYGCELCKQRFAHKTSLTLHMRLHSGVKPYVCGVCGKSFSQKGNLSEHERIHTGSKPYQCRECARAFTTSSQHRLHARRHQAQRQGSHALKRFAPAAVQRAHRRREEGARRRDEKAPQQIRNHKQVSLLVDKQQPLPLKVEPEPEVVVKPEEESMAPEAETEDGVIYVTYDVDVERDAPTYHILDTEETELMSDDKVVSNCSLYSGESLLLAEEEEEPTTYYNEDAHMAVTDEEGNPLHFTMQDGTRLAITSADGKSLQVITQDGQTIPVEINGYNEDEEEEEDSADTVVHQLSLQKDSDAAHYFTIV